MRKSMPAKWDRKNSLRGDERSMPVAALQRTPREIAAAASWPGQEAGIRYRLRQVAKRFGEPHFEFAAPRRRRVGHRRSFVAAAATKKVTVAVVVVLLLWVGRRKALGRTRPPPQPQYQVGEPPLPRPGRHRTRGRQLLEAPQAPLPAPWGRSVAFRASLTAGRRPRPRRASCRTLPSWRAWGGRLTLLQRQFWRYRLFGAAGGDGKRAPRAVVSI